MHVVRQKQAQEKPKISSSDLKPNQKNFVIEFQEFLKYF